MDMSGPGTWVLELGEGGHERQFLASASMGMRQQRQAYLLARAVESEAPALETATDGQVRALPEGSANGGTRHPSTERIDRKARAGLRKDVRNERGPLDVEQLRRERWSQCEDVVD